MPTDPSTRANPFLQARGLEKAFAAHPVLRGVDLDVPAGKTTVILGSSGGGKSVLLRLLLGLTDPDAGSILIEGEELTELEERKAGRLRRKIGMLFQNGALFDSMSVFENVVFPLREEGVRDREELQTRAREALRLVNLDGQQAKMPSELSGGMRKRVALARAVIHRPRAVFYDEPTAGLDPVLSDQIDHLIRRTNEKLGVTQVLVTHDMRSVYHVGHHVAFLRDGRIHFTGTPDDLRASGDPVIRQFILGISQDHPESPDAPLTHP